MSDVTIPEDIMRTAQAAAKEAAMRSLKTGELNPEMVIARAILAERERLFDALMAQYDGWAGGPGADDAGALALSVAIFNLFPEKSKSLVGAAQAIRSPHE